MNSRNAWSPQKIPAGRATVMAHDRKTGRVTVKLASGTLRSFAPGRVQPDRKSVAARLYVRGSRASRRRPTALGRQ